MFQPQVRGIVFVFVLEGPPTLEIEHISTYYQVRRFEMPDIFVHRIYSCLRTRRSNGGIDIIGRNITTDSGQYRTVDIPQEYMITYVEPLFNILRKDHLCDIPHGLHARSLRHIRDPQDWESTNTHVSVQYILFRQEAFRKNLAFLIRQGEHAYAVESASEMG